MITGFESFRSWFQGYEEQIDSKNIRKHKNDVFRLFVLLNAGERIHVLPTVNHDITEFIKAMRGEDVDLKQIGIISRSKNEILDSFLNIYYV